MAFDREITALTVFCEASGASPGERLAVLHVMFNRWKSGRFGATLAEVCLQRFQFSEWNDDKADNANLRRGARVRDDDPVLRSILEAYESVLAGGLDTTRGALHYHDKSIPVPSWARQAAISLETDHFVFYVGVA